MLRSHFAQQPMLVSALSRQEKNKPLKILLRSKIKRGLFFPDGKRCSASAGGSKSIFLTVRREEVAEILAEREKTKRMKTLEEEQTKREEAKLKHDTELKKIESDASEFMEGARRVGQGLDTVKSGLNTVKTIATYALIGVILIFIIVVLIVLLKHFG